MNFQRQVLKSILKKKSQFDNYSEGQEGKTCDVKPIKSIRFSFEEVIKATSFVNKDENLPLNLKERKQMKKKEDIKKKRRKRDRNEENSETDEKSEKIIIDRKTKSFGFNTIAKDRGEFDFGHNYDKNDFVALNINEHENNERLSKGENEEKLMPEGLRQIQNNFNEHDEATPKKQGKKRRRRRRRRKKKDGIHT